MKNRNRICYALDACGLIALLTAGLALAGALWFATEASEALLFTTFSNALMATVAAFGIARVYEIYQVFEATRGEAEEEVAVSAATNIEALPEREHLPRAA
jgi:hypothetical protein